MDKSYEEIVAKGMKDLEKIKLLAEDDESSFEEAQKIAHSTCAEISDVVTANQYSKLGEIFKVYDVDKDQTLNITECKILLKD